MADGIIAKLKQLGITEEGAKQVMAGQSIGSADDRRRIAEILGSLLERPLAGPSPTDAIATLTEPGSSKVSNRMIAENFD